MVLTAPEVARRSCAECVAWLYDDKPGQFAPRRMERGGKPLPRSPHVKPPCYCCPKQPDEVPESDRRPETACEPDDQFWAAKQFYDECRAVGEFPRDDLVRASAATFHRAYYVADLILRARLGIGGK